MNQDLTVLLIWHMHQPAYNVEKEPFLLPWTRLHATKDYIALADLTEQNPAVKVNFNFSPVLWDQIEAYTNKIYDRELNICLKSTDKLTPDEIRYFLSKAFLGNERSLIRPYPRYLSLYSKYKKQWKQSEAGEIKSLPNLQELRDLVCLRILAWIYPGCIPHDPFLSGMIEKGEFFSEEDKLKIIETSLNLIATIPHRYRTLWDKNQVEISTTPYYHPILPLLIDSFSAKEALPHIELGSRFEFPDEATWHVRAAILRHREIFNRAPSGMWPAEGSVSSRAASVFAKEGLMWIASDEDILARSSGVQFFRDSFGQINQPEILYRPWAIDTPHGRLMIVFRDHLLSDLIGFDYQKWNENEAVRDLIGRLLNIRDRMINMPFTPCVPIILDGENAWEHYPNGGFSFLKKLYSALTETPGLQLELCTPFLKKVEGQTSPLPRLAAGSWINGNFGIWIGHQEENHAWEFLKKTLEEYQTKKDELDQSSKDACEQYIHKAEASDWFWWYGDDHFCEEKDEFDLLFRSLLIKTYEKMNQKVPEMLQNSLLTRKSRRYKLVHPKTLLSPKIDGKRSEYYEWFGAGCIQIRSLYGAMHSNIQPIIGCVMFGFDLERMYFRLDPSGAVTRFDQTGFDIVFNFESAKPRVLIEFHFEKINDVKISEVKKIGSKYISRSIVQVAWADTIEVAIPFKMIGAKRNDEVHVSIEVRAGEVQVEQIPDQYGIVFSVPTEDYDNLMWEV